MMQATHTQVPHSVNQQSDGSDAGYQVGPRALPGHHQVNSFVTKMSPHRPWPCGTPLLSGD